MKDSPAVHYVLRLYIAGDAQNSVAAMANLQSICDRFLSGRHELEVIDVLREPKRAMADGILLTPMLLKLAPGPVRKIVGDLSQTHTVLQTLGLLSLAA